MPIDGFLDDVISWTRTFTDEPSADAKYSDGEIVELVQDAWAEILGQINRNSSSPIVARHDFTFDDDVDTYILPPAVGTVLSVQEVNSNGRVQWTALPRSSANPYGPGVIVEGNTLRFDPNLSSVPSSHSLRITYIPGGGIKLHKGTTTAVNEDGDEVTLPTTFTYGSLDTRPHAYVGMCFRSLGSSGSEYVQERIISEYDTSTRVLTLSRPLNTTLTGGDDDLSYEIAPLVRFIAPSTLALWVALDLLSIEMEAKRYSMLQRRLQTRLREARLGASESALFDGLRMETDSLTGTYPLYVW